MTEYLYDKENPRSVLKSKPLGWSSFYPGMPNHFERVEMIGRRVSKEFDGDLAKLSLDMNKTPDHAQRWRLLKNITRFCRNPHGFITWRFIYAVNQNRGPNMWYIFVGGGIAAIFLGLAQRSQSK